MDSDEEDEPQLHQLENVSLLSSPLVQVPQSTNAALLDLDQIEEPESPSDLVEEPILEKFTLPFFFLRAEMKFDPFPYNTLQWLDKEDFKYWKSAQIGSYWTAAVEYMDFAALTHFPHYKSQPVLYPFPAFRVNLETISEMNPSKVTLHQIYVLMELWGKMIMFILTKGFKRHPFWSAKSLREVAGKAVSVFPTLQGQYRVLVSKHNWIQNPENVVKFKTECEEAAKLLTLPANKHHQSEANLLKDCPTLLVSKDHKNCTCIGLNLLILIGFAPREISAKQTAHCKTLVVLSISWQRGQKSSTYR